MTKTVLITGASRGIGLATVEELVQHDYKIYATSRCPEKSQALTDLAARCKNVVIKTLDVTSEESIAQVVDCISKTDGRLDVVINNAGYGVFGPSETVTIEQAQQMFNVNLFGMMRMDKAVLPLMRKQMEGRIVNISSVVGAIPSALLPIYAASKAAFESLSATHLRDLAPWNIRVCVIEPGPVVTDFIDNGQVGAQFEGGSNPYGQRFEEDLKLWQGAMAKAQPASEVAQVIRQAIEDPEPHFRYQTSESGSKRVGAHAIDTDGAKIKAMMQ